MRKIQLFSAVFFSLFLAITLFAQASGQLGFGEDAGTSTSPDGVCNIKEVQVTDDGASNGLYDPSALGSPIFPHLVQVSEVLVQRDVLALETTLARVTRRSGADSPIHAPQSSQNIRSLQEKLSVQPAQTTSGFVEDEIFGTYEGYNLDQYLFRDEGPIRFLIYITRVFSKNKQGYNELIVGQPQLVLRVFDVDASCGTACDGCCEVDNVYVNGRFIGTLDGANDSWSTVRFDIPVEWFQNGTVRDATYNGPGIAPTPGENWIQIDIDTACGFCWAVQTDYGEIQVKGMRPAALFHGLNLAILPGGGEPASWNVFRTYIPGDLSEAYQLDGNGAVATNAGAVQGFIDQTLTGFGVRKINIIAHSKGGLDSTEAIVGSEPKIDNIITLGSPLLGTEYADHMYDRHRWAMPRSDEVAVNDLRTTTRATYYGTRTIPEPGVKYYHFAGNRFGAADSECPFPFDGTLIFAVENDSFVPVNRAFPRWRSSTDKIGPYEHSEMLSQRDVAEWAVQLMKDSVMGASASSIAQQSKAQKLQTLGKLIQATSTGPQYTFAISDSLTSGETKTYQIPIDSSVSKSQFFITYPATADFDLVLIDPSGARNDTPDFKGSFIPGGNLVGVFYEVSGPASGLWLMDVHANIDGEIQGGAELSTTLILNVATDKESYASGETISLTAALMKDGVPYIGANVVAHFTTLSGFSDSATLVDNMDGTYSASYTPPTGGYFTVKIDAESLVGERFQRETNVFVTVSPPSANIGGVVSESANDTDGNSLYNNLTLEINLQVRTEGDYLIVGRLEDSAGTLVANAASSLHLLPGSQNISLVFDGTTIRSSGRDGPYNLAQLTIHDLSQQGLVADIQTDAYLTAPYRFYEFEGPILAFGSGRDFVTDSDGDGFYNTLTIELEISLNPGYAGSYTYNAELQDLDGTGIEWYSNPAQYLDVGLNTIQLIYSGEAIAISGLDGPYQVGNFHLYKLDNPTIQLSSPNAFTTTAYRACQFQGAVPCNDPPVADAGPDQTVQEGSTVTLDGTGSYDPEGAPFTFAWTQLGGPPVTLDNPTSPTSSFRAPLVGSETPLTFQLIVNDGFVDSAPDTVVVTVQDLGASIYGTVTGSGPIAGAKVTLLKREKSLHTTVTDEAGFYAFLGLTPDRYRVEVTHPDFRRQRQKVKLAPGEDKVLDFTLTPL